MAFLLQDLHVYMSAEEIGEKIWKIVSVWPPFEKYGMGKQLTASTDSISANIAEGYGRFYIKENINFCFYARGSLFETKSWIKKATLRGVIGDAEYQALSEELE